MIYAPGGTIPRDVDGRLQRFRSQGRQHHFDTRWEAPDGAQCCPTLAGSVPVRRPPTRLPRRELSDLEAGLG